MAKMLTFKQFQATDDFGSYGLNGEWKIIIEDDFYIVPGNDDDFDGEWFGTLQKAEQYVYAMYANEYALTDGY